MTTDTNISQNNNHDMLTMMLCQLIVKMNSMDEDDNEIEDDASVPFSTIEDII